MNMKHLDVRNLHTEFLKRVPKKYLAVAAIVIAFMLGYFFAGGQKEVAPSPKAPEQAAEVKPGQATSEPAKSHVKQVQWWTCAMHPQIKLPHPGKCPICFMDLIPLEMETEAHVDPGLAQYSMSERAKKLAEVETTPVKRERAKVLVRMVGLVVEDETRIAALTSRVDGRLDQIYVNFTGVQVNKGDPMVTIWSPNLIKSQVELFETIRSGEQDESLIKGAEEKLIQLGMTQKQIEDIKEKKKPDLYVTLRAPINGVVTKKMALLGQFVKEGSEMFIINDLSNVWVKLDAYETDLPWIRYGQDMTFTTPAVPGQTFKGKVIFIDPMLDMQTRSVKIRVEAANPDYTLKPGMFVTAELQAEIDAKGRVVKPEWAGKYICPIHPRDEASSEPGTCPDSGMPLRPASSFGYADDKDVQSPLVVPASAPLITGKRAIVYVEVPNADRPTYELREVVLGPRAGDKYVVYKGLKEGELVVTRGNFKIDSAMQIVARPSMMSPEEAKTSKQTSQKADEELIEKLQAPPEFLKALTPVINEYLRLKEALVMENVDQAAEAGAKMTELVKRIDAAALEPKAKEAWIKLVGSMASSLKTIAEIKEIEAQRRAFDRLSESFARIVMGFRHVMEGPMFLYHCPMAFDKQGAYWLEAKQDPRNPYFGEKQFKGQDMLKCSELVERIPPETGIAEAGSDETHGAGSAPDKEKQGSDSKPGGTEQGAHSDQKEGDK